MSKPIFSKKEKIQQYQVQFFNEFNDGAEIYRVKDQENNTRRLKLYRKKEIPKQRFNENGILKEVEILKQADHPNIIKFIDSGYIKIQDTEYIFMVTEFFSGETWLDKLKREGVLNPYSVIPSIIELLNALNYLHQLDDPVIHNDLCPENITISLDANSEKPILTNFSSAVHLSKATRNFSSELLNPFYMAPEHFNGLTLPQSDIFGVGALIYQLCFGLPPWYFETTENDNFVEKLQKKRRNKLNFESSHPEIFDEHFKNVICKALATDINMRFKNAGELSDALNRKTEVHVSDASNPSAKKGSKVKGKGFEAIAGMQEMKDILYNDVIRAINEKELYESYGLTIPNGMLLYGPPGCGKTFIAEKFAEEVGFNFVKLNPSDVKSKFVNETEEKIGQIFKDAEEQAPSVLFFDKFDALVPSRDNNLHHMSASTVNEFLAQMSNSAEKEVFIIAATNRPDKIDRAVMRAGRLDKKIYIAPPDLDARKALFNLYLEKRPVELGFNYDLVAERSNLFVAGDIKFIIDEASRSALKSKSRINVNTILEVIADTTPSVKNEDLIYYNELQQKIDDNEGDQQSSRPIGFKH